MVELNNVAGVGPAAANLLGEIGIKSAEDLAKASVETVSAVRGISVAGATAMIKAAGEIVETAPAPAKEKAEKGKKKKKGKKDKKDKKKKKGKK